MKKLWLWSFALLLMVAMLPSMVAHAAVDNGYLSVRIGKVNPVGATVTIKGNGALVVKDLETDQVVHQFGSDTVVAQVQNGTIDVSGYTWQEVAREEVVSGGTIAPAAPLPVKQERQYPEAIIERLIPEGKANIAAAPVPTSQGQGPVIKGISQRYVITSIVNDPTFTISSTTYRGGLYLINRDGKLLTVNRVLLEEYLRGVVPKEIGPSSPHEALKAQAICARSFALSNIDKYRSKGYQLDDSPNSQVYYGKTGEAASSDKAIAETRGIIGTYEGKPASLIFGASSGGLTESAEQVWGGAVPYLTVVDDPYSKDAPYADWEFRIGLDKLTETFANTEYNVGQITDVVVEETSPQHTVKKLTLVGANGSKTISGDRFRYRLDSFKIMSTWFTTAIEGDELVVAGHGFGHRVGMSQHGAITMAKQGKGARDILAHYYPGVVIN